MNYDEAIKWLYSTQDFGIKLGLENPKELLRKFLANPDYNTKVVHVAGTNGKGSTCAMIEMLIRGAGYRTALFTSPHLVHFRERIKVNSIMISEQKCADYLTQLRVISEKMAHHPTFFEITLALAMRYFREQGAEYIILETGMGGRLDATTAVQADVCVITPIGMDHSEWLGDTIEEVAMEKAGIMLEGVPIISAKQQEEARVVLLEEANVKRCPIQIIDEPLVGYSIGITGEHQRYNANVAVHAVYEVGIQLNYDLVKESLKYVYWPGRFEEIRNSENPMVIDGAHNPHAVEALVNTWQTEYPDLKPIIVFGAVESKDVEGALSMLKQLGDQFILTPVNSPRSYPTEKLKQALGNVGNVTECENLEQVLELEEVRCNPVLVVGSLFLIGQLKALVEDGVFEPSLQ